MRKLLILEVLKMFSQKIKLQIYKIKNNRILIAAVFLLVTTFFLKETIFSPGVILGGDWSLPATRIQMEEYFNNSFTSWINQGNLLGIRQPFLTSFPAQVVAKIFSSLPINGEFFPKTILVFLFTFASCGMYILLRFFNIKKAISVLGGLFYITTPLFFNYSIMGWQFVLMTMGLLPFAVKYFIKSVQEKKTAYIIVVGMIYGISIMQSQSLFWFLIIFFALGFFLIKNKKTLLVYLKTLTIVVAIFLLLNFFWIIGLLIVPDKTISGSDIVNSTSSLGTVGNFSLINLLRLWGALFNYQYETIMNKSGLLPLSFVLPLLAVGSLFIKKNKKIIITIWLVAFIPVLMYILNFHRNILLQVPFSNVIRDFSRFTILSTFAVSFLAAVFLDYLFEYNRQRYKKIVLKLMGAVLVSLWLASIFPWWTGKISKWEDGINQDIRLRTKVFPEEYFVLETTFLKKKLDQKALYLPIRGMVNFDDDLKFHGSFKETSDIFALYSPIEGMIGLSDKDLGYMGEFVNVLKDNLPADLTKRLSKTNIKYFIIRKDMLLDNKKEIIQNFESNINKKISKYFDQEKIAVYSINNFLPHFYTPNIIMNTEGLINEMRKIIEQSEAQTRSAIYFQSQNKGKDDFLNSMPENVEKTPVIEFKKNNLTKYRLRIHNASKSFPLVFSESFHDEWKIYTIKSDKLRSSVKSQLSSYKILDGNKEDQASVDELRDFIDQGWVTTMGDGKEKKTKHIKYENGKEKLDYVEKYNIDFVSKNFQGTIQNNNLPSGSILETWFKKPIENNENHLTANGYANSWIIDPQKICDVKDSKCVKNPDGTYDMELVVEFWPQRLFYIGLGISGTILLLCLGYLVWDFARNKKRKEGGAMNDKV